MSDGDPEPLYNDDGDHVGYQLEAPDGAVIGVDLSGEIVAAYAPDGTELDESEYGWADDDDDAEGYDDPGAEFDARLDELEQRVAEPYQVEYVPGEPGVSPQAQSADMIRQGEDLERILGRPLLLSERRAIVERIAAEADATGGGRPDLLSAAGEIADLGEGFLDLDSGHRGQDHEARTRFMTARLQDNERTAAAHRDEDDLASPVAPPSADWFDLDDRSQRHEYLAERLEGRNVDPDDTYSSSDV